MSSNLKMRWGILGAGGIARKFVSSARAAEGDHQVVAVASNTPGKARSFADTHSIPQAFESYPDLLADKSIDTVYVANTHNFHCDTVLMALDAGKHVLCEKPLAVNARQAGQMIERARANNRFLMEAMWTRFLPACQQLVRWINEGRIGEVRQIEATFGFSRDWDPQGRMLNPELAGGTLLDMGIYPLSFSSLIMKGERPSRVVTDITVGETGVDEDDVLVFSYQNGVKAVLRCSLRTSVVNHAIVIGTRGMVRLPPSFIGQNRVELITESEEVRQIFPPTEDRGFQYEIAHVGRCISEGLTESPVMPLNETLKLAETMDHILNRAGVIYPGS